ncbi:OmpA family protein [Klebsiella pneumoniae]|uniref:OmpA family protein n=1 Tax=Klebsiella pneumoniae TaxID=573 RepID=UPI001B8C2CF3|nr:OmpA family protein [Klebsiella pneumoniae]MBQ5019202.1 OmpA family protein [Klebsiella pneumoniae]MBQ5041862.1 OmpA family protein [Klebsiella pneumoniae]HBW1955320.1 OmpA family protein [Klebsiella pneumoniae]HCM7601155.1 OmpA family protein [Klebsiella pneumoniae]HDP8923525.1 OmpA family protein [Klebsiella pneumoniae]
MIRKYFVPALMAAALLTGCQAPQGKFTPEQVAATGITHSRLEGHTDNYGEDSYNEALSLKRANSVADAWAEGAHVPRSNLVTRGLGKKYPIASNDTAAGRAENRRVTVVISTP